MQVVLKLFRKKQKLGGKHLPPSPTPAMTGLKIFSKVSSFVRNPVYSRFNTKQDTDPY